MESQTFRLIALIIFTVLLVLQAMAARNQPNRRRAFLLSALAVLALGTYAGVLVPQLQVSTRTIFGWISFAFGLGALLSYFAAVRSGELKQQVNQYFDKMRDYGKQRQGRDRH